jgi:hypothetical protein
MLPENQETVTSPDGAPERADDEAEIARAAHFTVCPGSGKTIQDQQDAGWCQTCPAGTRKVGFDTSGPYLQYRRDGVTQWSGLSGNARKSGYRTHTL